MKRIFLASMFIAISFTLSAQYVKVLKDGVNIRKSPSQSSQVICKSIKGDILKMENITGEWYLIKIGYAKEKRYIHKTMCEPVSKIHTLPNVATCKKVYLDLRRAEKKAQDSADKEVPTSASNYVNKLIDAEAKYFSKHTMQVFHKYKIAPALYGKIVDLGSKNNWNKINLY